MEIHAHTTRFALACNLSNKIIEPIQSRCAILRYSKLSDSHLLQRLIEVCGFENASYTNDGLEALIFTAEGDMRNAINNLQSTVSGFGTVNSENVYRVCDAPHPTVVKGMLNDCLEGRIYDAREKLTLLWTKGTSIFNI